MSWKRIASRMIGAGVFVDGGLNPAIQIVFKNVDFKLLMNWLVFHPDVYDVKRMSQSKIKVRINTGLNYIDTVAKLDEELKCQFL